mmetsp:Transcript_58519/g.154100  ORF Transcript_58519/g.154100 Transcript_58519/m.154100 type:complete len:85 (-) Transcript_58519:42-296(-)
MNIGDRHAHRSMGFPEIGADGPDVGCGGCGVGTEVGFGWGGTLSVRGTGPVDDVSGTSPGDRAGGVGRTETTGRPLEENGSACT